MNTPWGYSDFQQTLTRGLTIVGTPSHGGAMVSRGFAKNHLTNAARNRAYRFGDYYAYEEDCDIAIVMYELPEYFSSEDRTSEEIIQSAIKSLSMWYADYLLELGVEPSPEQYEEYKANRLEEEMRKNHDPDLIIACWGDWHTKISGVNQVATADGKVYHITKNSSDYAHGIRPFLLSNCEVIREVIQ